MTEMRQPRRRRLPPTQLDTATPSPLESNEGIEELERSGKVKRRRKRRRRTDATKFGRNVVLSIVLGAAFAVSLWKTWSYSLHPLRMSSISSVKQGLRSISGWRTTRQHLKHVELYNAVRQAVNNNHDGIPTYEKRPFTLNSTYGSNVTEGGCKLTVVSMDPRLATARPGESHWFSLESVAAFRPDACVLLQTASCEVREELEASRGIVSEKTVNEVISDHIYGNSLPLFRNMIERGMVRVTFPNHAKYNLKSCSDYGNPSSALMNIHYWTDEFIARVDSEHVLFIQDDAVLCHEFYMDDYVEYAFVGSVWSKKSFQLTEGMCNGMPLRWSSWLAPQKRWERQQKRLSTIPTEKRLPRPDVLLNGTFPDVCSDCNCPVGNGGLSLRSRSWAIQAIESCPHVKYSGIDSEGRVLACQVLEDINEDLYFGIVLRGIGAPFPSAIEAALFSTEMLWPEQVVAMFGAAQTADLSSNHRHRIIHDGTEITVPVAVHKPWWYHSSELLHSTVMNNACPFLQYIYPTEQSEKWKEWQRLRPAEDMLQWQGIGA